MENKIKTALIFFSFFALSAQSSMLFNLDDGIKLYQKSDLIAAKSLFEEYVLNNPNDKDGYFMLALTEQKLNNKKSAKENFKKSYEILASKKNIEKISFDEVDLANLEDYFDMATMYFEEGNLKQAKLYADLMLKINKSSPSAYFIKAQIANTEGDIESAKAFLTIAISYNNKYIETNLAKNLKITTVPKLPKETYMMFALENYFCADFEKAIKYLKKSLEMEYDPETYAMLIEVYIKKGDLISAQNTLEEAKKNSKETLSICLLQARISNLKNEDVKEEYSLQKAYKLNPNNEDVLLSIANFYLKQKNYEKAKKYFSTLIQINDELYEAYSGYIYTLIETGEIKKAQNIIQKLKQLNPDSSEILYYLARICEYQGYFNDALDYISEAKDRSENPLYYIESSEINYVLKDYESALADLEELDNLLTDNYDKKTVTDYKVKNYLKLKDEKEVIKLLNTYSESDKDSITYKYYLYRLYNLKNNPVKIHSQAEVLAKTRPQNVQEAVEYSNFALETKGLEATLKYLNSMIKKYPDNGILYLEKIKLCFLKENKPLLEKTISELDSFYNPKE